VVLWGGYYGVDCSKWTRAEKGPMIGIKEVVGVMGVVEVAG